MPRFLALLLLLVFPLVAKEKVLTIAVSSNVGVLNPQGYAQNQMYAQNVVYEGLTGMNSKGEIIPSLAMSWEVKESGALYVFNLRRGVKFSNGEEFDALAAKKNLDSVAKNRVRHSWSHLALLIDEVKAIDKYTLELRLKQPYAPTLAELSLVRPYRFLAPSLIPDDLDLVGKNPEKPIGTGPYSLEKTELGRGDRFVRNPHYWNAATYNGIYFDAIQTKIIVEPNAKLIALRAGEVDLIYGYDEIPIEVFKQVAKSADFSVYQGPPIFTTSLVLNPANRFLESKQIRLALALSVDKDSIIKAVYGGLQSKADFLFQDGASGLSAPSFNPTEAVALIEKEGFSKGKDGYYYKGGKRLEIDLAFVGKSPTERAVGEVLQSQFKQVGVFLRLAPSEESIYKNRVTKGGFDICFHQTWGRPYEPLMMINSMRYFGHTDYVAQKPLPNKAEIDSMIQEAIAMPKLGDFLPKLLGVIYDSHIYIPLTMQTNKALARKGLKGINLGVHPIEIPFWEFYE